MSCSVCGGSRSKIDPATNKLAPCPRCVTPETADAVNEQGVMPEYVLLGFSKPVALTDKLNTSLVFTEKESRKYSDESIKHMKRILVNLNVALKNREELTSSYIIGLPTYSDLQNVLYPMMLAALRGGYKVPPWISSTEVRQASRSNYGQFVDTYQRLLNAEIAFVVVEAGSSPASIESVYGLIQTRGLRGYPTLVFTGLSNDSFEGVPEMSEGTLSSPGGFFTKPEIVIKTERSSSDDLGIEILTGYSTL